MEAELPREYSAYSHWTMCFNGSKMLAGLGAGVVLMSPTGDNIRYILQIMYTDSNIAAEYEALLHGKLLKIMKKKLSKDNELPASTYKANKVVYPLRLEVQKIHACPNDCILYRGEEYENLNACPVYGALQYKIRRDDTSDVEGERPRKRVPAKVMWYAPIIPRLKRL